MKTRILIIIALMLAFVFLAWFVPAGKIDALEAAVYARIAGHITPGLTDWAILITDIGAVVPVAAICTALLILPVTRLRFGAPASAAAAVSALLNLFLKELIARDRPDILWLVMETGYGFPSGHAMNNAALYAVLAMMLFRHTKKKRYRLPGVAIAILIPFCIGISRIYLGVHNAGDILAGWIAGVAVALVIDTLFARLVIPRINKN